jgi:hypothetical protein
MATREGDTSYPGERIPFLNVYLEIREFFDEFSPKVAEPHCGT